MHKLIGHEPNVPKMLADLHHPMPVFDHIPVVRKDFFIPDNGIADVWERWREKVKLNNEFGPIGRPDGDIQFNAPLFDKQIIGRGFRQPINIRMLPTWNFADFVNGPVLVPDKPALRLKQLKPRNNEGLAVKGNDLVFKPARHIHLADDFDKLVDDVRADRKKAKQDGLKQLQGFWKAAQGPKEGIGYGHPAHKGFFAAGHVGRNHKWRMRMQPIERIERPRLNAGFDLFGGGIGVGLNNLCLDINPWGPGGFAQRNTPTNERVERQARRERERQRAASEHDDWMRSKDQKAWNTISYIKIKLKWLDEPGANICQIIADVCAHSKSNGYHIDVINDGLESRGFTALGNGHFSRAYKGPDGFVYKVNCNNSSHDAWYVYGLNCMYYGQGIDCLPKIDAIAYSNTTYCVKMGLLSPITRDEFNEKYLSISDAFRGSGNVLDVMKYLNLSRPAAIDVMSIVDRTKRETPGSRFDIHYENVMYRIDANGNKTLVLTDPLAYGDFIMSDFDDRLAACNAIASNVPQLAKAA